MMWTRKNRRRSYGAHFVALASFTLICCSAVAPTRVERPALGQVDVAESQRGMVVSETVQASRAGSEILSRGGNAVDAAVATAFALAVTWPEAGNIGGGGFMMIAPADGSEPVCIDYRETAPLASTEDMYAPDADRHDYRAVGVPGTVAGLALAHERYGSLPWRDLVMPAVSLAEAGFTLDRWQAYSINVVMAKQGVASEPQYANLRRVFARPGGGRWRAGDILRQPELARTLRMIAEQGPEAFYTGDVAELIVQDMQRHGGLITAQDLARYTAKVRPAIHGTYRGFDLYGPPPPSSGGIVVVQVLNILEAFTLDKQDRYAARNTHLMTEAMRRAFRDRAAYLGDSDFVEIPAKLTDKTYALELAAQINPQRATPSAEIAGDIVITQEGDSTTHFSVIDTGGMAVSNTYTLEQAWGSRMVVADAGFVLNNEMGDFNWVRGYTNINGKIGTEPNLIEPGKRMLSSMSPFIIKRDGQVMLITGSPGGRSIINTAVNVILNCIEFDMPLDQAVASPRFHHQWFPNRLSYEAADEPTHRDAVAALRAMGHDVEAPTTPQGSAHSIWVDPATGAYVGVADNRRGGSAVGVRNTDDRP